MLGGGSLEDAFFAATTAATQAGFEAVLDANPTFYGTDKSIKSVLNSVTDNVILKLTGNIDLLSAGTGNGVGSMTPPNAIPRMKSNTLPKMQWARSPVSSSRIF